MKFLLKMNKNHAVNDLKKKELLFLKPKAVAFNNIGNENRRKAKSVGDCFTRATT